MPRRLAGRRAAVGPALPAASPLLQLHVSACGTHWKGALQGGRVREAIRGRISDALKSLCAQEGCPLGPSSVPLSKRFRPRGPPSQSEEVE